MWCCHLVAFIDEFSRTAGWFWFCWVHSGRMVPAVHYGANSPIPTWISEPCSCYTYINVTLRYVSGGRDSQNINHHVSLWEIVFLGLTWWCINMIWSNHSSALFRGVQWCGTWSIHPAALLVDSSEWDSSVSEKTHTHTHTHTHTLRSVSCNVEQSRCRAGQTAPLHYTAPPLQECVCVCVCVCVWLCMHVWAFLNDSSVSMHTVFVCRHIRRSTL